MMTPQNDKLGQFAIESMGREWYELLDGVVHSLHFAAAAAAVATERSKGKVIYPLPEEKLLMFRAFKEVPPKELKVVILGQDPYHNGMFDGLAFSNGKLNTEHLGKTKSTMSPSLRVILQEVERDCYNGMQLNQDPDLKRWANQGVLLMNTAFTVERGKPLSHVDIWEPVTAMIMEVLDTMPQLVYILWGMRALSMMRGTKTSFNNNCVIVTAHPAAELRQANAGFIGSKCFSRANDYLVKINKEPIIW